MAVKKRRIGPVIVGLLFGISLGVAFDHFVLTPHAPGGDSEVNQKSAVELATARKISDINQAQAQAADEYVSSISEAAVEGKLTGKNIAIIRTGDAEKADVDNVTWLLKIAGATITGEITFKERFLSQDGADSVKNLVVNTLPAGAQLSADRLDSGTHSGEAFAAALLVSPETGEPLADEQDRALLLDAFTEGGFIESDYDTALAADAVIIVTGDADGTGPTAFATTNLKAFTQAMEVATHRVVLAGRIHTASDTGVIGELRSADSTAATIDSVGRSYGRLGAVLAVPERLEGKTGAYGAAANAKAALPAD